MQFYNPSNIFVTRPSIPQLKHPRLVYTTQVNLTNRMWFSVVYSFIANDTRHHSGQNVVNSRGAAAEF